MNELAGFLTPQLKKKKKNNLAEVEDKNASGNIHLGQGAVCGWSAIKGQKTLSDRTIWNVLSKCLLLIHASSLLPFRQRTWKVCGNVF